MDVSSDIQRRITLTISHVSLKIRALRMERGLTVQELADRCGIERSNLSRIEAGRTNMTLRTLCTICFALKVELIDLLPVCSQNESSASESD